MVQGSDTFSGLRENSHSKLRRDTSTLTEYLISAPGLVAGRGSTRMASTP